MTDPRMDRLVRLAMDHHRAGRFQQAKEGYGQVLKCDPGHGDALHLLGLICVAEGDATRGLALAQKAVAAHPETAIYHNSLGIALKEQGAFAQAAAAFRRALELKPDYGDAHHNLGSLLRRGQQLPAAIESFRRALATGADQISAGMNLADCLQEVGDRAAAAQCYRSLLAQMPEYAPAMVGLGHVLSDMGQKVEALEQFTRVLAIEPENAAVALAAGNACQDLYRMDAAFGWFEKAQALDPDMVEAANNMGLLLQRKGQFADAVKCYQHVLNRRPADAEAVLNLGTVWQASGEYDAAESCYRQAIAQRPDFAIAWNNLGVLHQESDRHRPALDCFYRALHIDPQYPEACSHLVQQLARCCHWEAQHTWNERLQVHTRNALQSKVRCAEQPFYNLQRCDDPAINGAVARSWGRDIERHCLSPQRWSQGASRVRCPGKSLLRIGYLSNNFRDHPTAHLIRGLLKRHDRSRFQVIAISSGKDDHSRCRRQIEQGCDRFVDIRGQSHEAAAETIFQENVDILVDLMGHTRGSCLSVCAFRPAPVQVRYLGMAGTTGTSFFDYLITDPMVTPLADARFYSEVFAYMPDCYQVNDYRDRPFDPGVTRLSEGIDTDGIVFCCFNQAYKIEPVMFSAWMRILRLVPDSLLWLMPGNPLAQESLQKEAQKHGIDALRLVFAGKRERSAHLQRLALADLFLDTRVVNGAATTSDALWAGVPGIALRGNHFSSRMSASILHAVGLPELVTASLAEYERLAVALAGNRARLQGLRQHLARARKNSALFDTERFTRNLEELFCKMWARHLTGAKPTSLSIGKPAEGLPGN